MPALTGNNQVKARLWQARRFGRRLDVSHADSRLAIDTGRFFHQWRRAIEPDRFASARGESTRQRTGTGAKIERACVRADDAHRCQPIEERRWKPRPML